MSDKHCYIKHKNGSEEYEILLDDVGDSFEIKPNLDGKKELTFTITCNSINYLAFNLIKEDNVIVVDEFLHSKQRYIITNCKVSQNKGVLTKQVSALHIFVMLGNYHRVFTTTSAKLSLAKAFDIALKGSGITVVLDSSTNNIGSVTQEEFGKNNATQLIEHIVSDYGVEIIADNTKIYVYKNYGITRPVTLDSRYNMSGLEIESDMTESTTRAVGRSKYNEKTKKYDIDVTYIHPQESQFLIEGKPRYAEDIEDDRYKSEESMINALKKIVNPYPKMTVSLNFNKFYDEKVSKYSSDFYIGDTIRIIADTDENGTTFEDKVRVIEMSYNPLDKYSNPSLTLANFRKDIYDIRSAETKRLRNQSRYTNTQLVSISGKIDNANIDTSQITQELNNQGARLTTVEAYGPVIEDLVLRVQALENGGGTPTNPTQPTTK